LYTDNSFNNYRKEIWDEVLLKPQGSVFCNDTTSVPRIFNSSLSYCKGAALLHMIRWIVGDTDFFQAIRNYLNDPRLKYGFARNSDFKKKLEDQSGKDLTEFFADWYYGSGVPNYQLVINQQLNLSTTVTINQTQYNSDVSFFNMILPVKFKGGEKDTTILFNHSYSGHTFSFKPDFRIDSVFFDPQNKILYYQSELTLNQVSQNQTEIEDQMFIMPNPAKGFLKVQHMPGLINYMQIFDLDGKSEITSPVIQKDTLLELNIQSLQPGMYFLKIGTPEWTETRKFIVIK